jgi:peptidoglycan/xylan/chitin deacetylase (PgdA/CDA1 family)
MLKTTVKRLGETVLRFPMKRWSSDERRVLVLAYHTVDPAGGRGNTLPSLFRRQVEWLTEHCQMIRIEDALTESRASGRDRPRVAITFDDGFTSVHEHALPLLAEHSIPATFFVTTGLVEGQRDVLERYARLMGEDVSRIRGLSWSQVDDLARAGMSICPHTVTHPNLASLPGSTARHEIERSRDEVADRIGTAPVVFAYPFGKPKHHFTNETKRIVRDLGFSMAGAIHHRGVQPGDDPFALPRFSISDEDESRLQAIVSGERDGVGVWQQTAPRWLSHALSPENSHRSVGSLLPRSPAA